MKSNNIQRTTPWFILTILALLISGFIQVSPARSQTGAPASFADLAEKYGPMVVNISSTQNVKSRNLPYEYFYNDEQMPEEFRHFFDMPQGPRHQHALPSQKRTSLGSGVIASADGYILTNNHVVEDADEINVRLANAEEYRAKIIGRDPKTDLALVKIDPKHDLNYVTFGDSDRLRVGDWVIAIGNPFGFEQTITAGIVSGKGRAIGDGPYQNFIQTDASINPGNSGGPLFDMNGQLMGINTAIFSRSGGNIGLGFAIPANMVKSVFTQLKGSGKVTRGMIGVIIQPVTQDLARQFKLDRTIGALIGQVTPGGPAE
ncbi:MAG: trypsin-like peptidase domain-containing protein, partial [Desulfobulbaceae bacterium]|nr:trypsin-like peptidase domain-containing protein [Desulfobulbaceae bacterium]